jgi:hypothetical protein
MKMKSMALNGWRKKPKAAEENSDISQPETLWLIYYS